MPVMHVQVRPTVVMTITFFVIHVVLHVVHARVILCMLMLVVVHMLANLVSVARVAYVL
jgi:hypothetical protein